MRRNTENRRLAARWVVSGLNVDPFALPARYVLNVAGRLARLLVIRQQIVLGRRSVAVQISLLGIRLAPTRYALSRFDGIALRIESLGKIDDEKHAGFIYSINLHHKDENLCLPLYISRNDLEVGAKWQSFGRYLRLPLLVPGLDGSFRPADRRLGHLHVKNCIHRPNALALKSRHPVIHHFRNVGQKIPQNLYQGEEIIARH